LQTVLRASSQVELITPASTPTAIVKNQAKIWIDLDNSPHVPFFAPIIEALEARGYAVFLTARDCFQVPELVAMFNLDCRIIGRHYGKSRLLKVAGTCWRALQLAPLALREKPQLAISHGSRAQLLASAMLGIPSIAIMDYEFARWLEYLRPRWVMVPDVVSLPASRFNPARVLRYPGIKEDVYVPRFRPDPQSVEKFGLIHGELVVTVRPPASDAHYHNPESDELFVEVMNRLESHTRVRVILLPRSKAQLKTVSP